MRTMALACAELLMPAVLLLTGCGVAPKVTDPAATAGVERCGSPTRACWQVKTTVDAVEYPPETASTTAVQHDSAEQSTGAH